MIAWNDILSIFVAIVAIVATILIMRQKKSLTEGPTVSGQQKQRQLSKPDDSGDRERIESYLNKYYKALFNLFYEQKLDEYVAFHFPSLPIEYRTNLREKVADKELANQGVPDEIFSAPLFSAIVGERLKKNANQRPCEPSWNKLQKLIKEQSLLEAHQTVLMDVKDYIQNDAEKQKWQSVWESHPTSFRT